MENTLPTSPQPIQPQSTPTPQPVPAATPENSTKVVVLLAAVVLILGVGAAGYYLGVQRTRSQAEVEPVVAVPSPITEVMTESPVPDMTVPQSLSLQATTMGEQRDYTLQFAAPSSWTLSYSDTLHMNDDLVQGCKDIELVSANGTRLNITTYCSTWVGQTARIPEGFVVVADLGKVGNDAAQKYLVRYRDPNQPSFNYATLSSNTVPKPTESAVGSTHLLVSYEPDDWYFIPVRASLSAVSESDLATADAIVQSLQLQRR